MLVKISCYGESDGKKLLNRLLSVSLNANIYFLKLPSSFCHRDILISMVCVQYYQCTFLVTCFRFSPFFVKEKTKRNIQLCYKQFIQSCVLNWFYLQTVFHKSTLSLMFRREKKSIDGIVMQKEFSIKIKMQF